jgi:hypothetical protein
MKRRRGQDELPWYVWLAVGLDPLAAAFVVAAQAPNTIQLITD